MAHLVIFEEFKCDLIVMSDWLPLEMANPGCYAVWLDSLPLEEFFETGSKLRIEVESNPILHHDLLVQRCQELADMGEMVVGKYHGWYFLGSTLRRTAAVALLQGYFVNRLSLNTLGLFGPRDRMVWDLMVAVGLLSYRVTGDPSEAALHGLTSLEARYLAWFEDHGRWLISSQVFQEDQPEAESWD
jgi:hypothetical protein